MAFAHVGNIGTALSSANNQATLVLTTTAQALAGSLVAVLIAVDNVNTTDGDSTAVSGVVDSAGNTYTRLKGFANGQAAAQAGADISIWIPTGGALANTLNSGGTITATFQTASLADASAMTAKNFSMAAGHKAVIEGTPGSLANDGASAGSLNVTTANIACLRIRAIAAESNSTTALTPTSTWAIFAQAVSGGGTSATEMGVRGEWLISTATGAASAPTGGAGAVDHASAYVALKEEQIASVGTLTKTLAALTCAATNLPPLRVGLVAWWELNETTGNRVNAHGLAGTELSTDFNDVPGVAGLIGNAADIKLAVDGGGILRAADHANLSTGNIDFSIAGWIRFDALPTSSANIASKWENDTTNDEWRIEYSVGTDLFYFQVSNGAGTAEAAEASTFGTPGTGVYIFIAAVCDKTNNLIKISINAGAQDTTPKTITVADGTGWFRLSNADRSLDAKLDTWAFWKRALTADEITQLYNAGAGLTYDETSGEVEEIVGTLSKTLGALTSTGAGALPIVGSLNKTLSNLTTVSSGALPAVGSLNKTLDVLTVVAIGGVTPIAGAVNQTLQALTAQSAGSLAVAGSVSKTLDALTSVSAGALPIVGTLPRTLGDVTLVSAGALPIVGSLNKTLNALTLVAVGGATAIAGVTAKTLQALTAQSAGALSIVGSVSKTLDALTVAALGKLETRGVVSKTLAALAASSAARLAITSTAATQLSALTVASTGKLEIKGFVFKTLANLTASSAGKLALAGVSSTSLGDLQASAAGRLAITAAAAAQLAALTAAATGNLAINGAVAKTLDDLLLDASGISAISGSVLKTFAALLSTGEGKLPIVAVGAGQLAPLTLEADGHQTAVGSGFVSKTLAPLLGEGDSRLAIAALSAKTLQPLVVVGQARLAIEAAAGVTLSPLLGVGSGQLAIAAAALRTLQPLTLQATGDLGGFQPITGSLDIVLAPLTAFRFSRVTKRISITAQKSMTPVIIAQQSAASIIAQRSASSSWDAQS